MLKKFLALKDLNSPFHGGLSSYGVILLIIAFLNEDQQMIYNPTDGMLSAGRALTQFLYFYGKVFDTMTMIINEYGFVTSMLDTILGMGFLP